MPAHKVVLRYTLQSGPEIMTSGVLRRLMVTWVILLGVAASASQEPSHSARFAFKGKLLVIACDADMVPSAYSDGKLGPPAGADQLVVARLDEGSAIPSAQLAVSNSVTGPPAAVAVTPDGRYALIVETQGPRPPGMPNARLKDLSTGRKISVVDLADPSKPRLVQQIISFERAVSISVNYGGDLVAVTFAPEAHTKVPLVLYHFREGRLTDPSYPILPSYTEADELSDAEFVPGQHELGVVFTSDLSGIGAHPRIALFKYSDLKGVVQVTPWGNEVAVDASPYLVKFTSDGRFALVNSMKESADGRGTISSIELSTARDGHEVPKHRLVSRAETGKFPEGLAISPDTRWVATTNLENSYLPLDNPDQQFFASLSLLRFDSQTGRLSRIGEFPFDGLLPEPIIFDNSSRFIAAGSFGRYDDPKANGAIHFWRVEEVENQPGRIELIHLEEVLPVPRGPQSMAIVR